MQPIKPQLRTRAHFVPSRAAVSKASAAATPPPIGRKPAAPTSTSPYQKNLQRVLRMLQDLYGIGQVGAVPVLRELFRTRLLTVQQLPEITSKELHQLLKTPAIFQTLPIATQQHLINDPLPRIPRALIQALEKEVLKLAKTYRFVVAGSYLRGAQDSGDIDAVLQIDSTHTWDGFRELVNTSKLIRIKDPFNIGESKIAAYWEFKVSARSPLRSISHIVNHLDSNIVRFKVDCFLASPDTWVPTLLYATGSGQFNLRMRAVAKKRGLLLNQNGVYHRDSMELIPTKTEEDIFKVVGVNYLPPEKRIL